MRGRSPFNKPPVRKTDVYRFLIKLGGEGRWKDLKAHLKEFGWGPTTLKRTLDEMIEEGSIYKEARLGRAGPEAWYITKVKDTDIWDAIKREYVPFEQLVLGIQNTLQELEGKQEEKEVFLKRQLQKLVRMPMDAYAALVFMVTGGVKNGKITRSESLRVFDYLYDTVLKNTAKEPLQFCLEYPQHALEVIDQMLREAAEKEKHL